MIEDAVYRSSTQFRLWSFTKDSLSSTRAKTNTLACERIRAAQRRVREAHRSTDNTPSKSGEAREGPKGAAGDGLSAAMTKDVECLTPAEEMEFVQYYCETTLELGDTYKPPLPTIVRATAIQYLRRFYLTNSVMAYHPKQIMPCALFLATKTENFYMSLREFANGIPGSGDTKAEEIIAPEYTLTQGLRFTFDVRHPFRGLDGGIMELQAIANGEGKPGPHHPGQSPEGLKAQLHSIGPLDPSAPSQSINTRIANAHTKARDILKTAAQMTDAYFFYTPSQIWLSALLLADRPLAECYFDIKIGPVVEDGGVNAANPLASIRMKLLTRLSDCVALLDSYVPISSDIEKRKSLVGFAKRVHQCQNIDRLDAAARTASPAKRTSGDSPLGGEVGISESERERVAKKRRLERERREKEGRDIFGGELVAQRTKQSS